MLFISQETQESPDSVQRERDSVSKRARIDTKSGNSFVLNQANLVTFIVQYSRLRLVRPHQNSK